MSMTSLAQVNDQIQKFWSPMFAKELKEKSILASLVSKQYQGEIKKGGDTVRISQINRPTAQMKTIGSGHETFASTALSTEYVDLKCDKVISAALEFDDLVDLQSQIGAENSAIRNAMREAVEIQLNSYLYSLVSPSTSAPDHVITGVTDFNATQLGAVRVLAAQAKWAMEGGWYGLLSPQYYQDILNVSTFSSQDFVPDMPVVGGQIVQKRFGFNLLEDNSAGLATLHASDAGLFFHPDFLYLAMPSEVEFKVSDLHSNKQFGYVISARLVCGAKLGLDGAVKHISVIGS